MKVKLIIFSIIILLCVAIPFMGNEHNKDKIKETKIKIQGTGYNSVILKKYDNINFNNYQYLLYSNNEIDVENVINKSSYSFLYSGSLNQFKVSNYNNKMNDRSTYNLYSKALDKPSEIKEKYMYTNTIVNIRNKSNVKSKILDVLSPNVCVRIIREEKDWNYVSVDEDLYGYIKNEYLSSEEISISLLNRWGIDLTEKEIELLAKVIWLEARGETQKGKECVIEVIFNRMISNEFRGSLYEVLSAKKQFSTWRIINTADPSVDEITSIYNVLYGNTNHLDIDYTYFSTSKVNGCNFIKIGKHWFSKANK